MKFIIIPYIALGMVLSLVIGIEYNCLGSEMFPEYYGSPFVFKQKSLASSMEYYYSISGILLNVLVWSMTVSLVRWLVMNLIGESKNSLFFRIIYNGIIAVLMLFTTLNIMIDSVTLGNGFRDGTNYWYMDLESEAKDWGMKCEGEVVIFRW